MSLFKNVTVGVGATDVITAAEAQSAPLDLENKSDKDITLTSAGSSGDTYILRARKIQRRVPGNGPMTATVASGTALLVVHRAGMAPGEDVIGATPADPVYTSPVPAVPAGGLGKWSVGQEDFTAVRASDTTLTLGTFPTAMGTVDDEKFQLVEVTPLVGPKVIYVATVNKMSLAGQVLTVAGAAFAADDIAYDVIAWGPPRGYDASTNSEQVTPLTTPRRPQDSPQKIGTGLGDGTTPEYFDVEQGQDITIRILDTPGVAGDNTYTLWTSQLNDSTAEGSADYQNRTLELVGQAAVTGAQILADPSIGVWQVNGFQAKRFLVQQVRANDGANNDGAYQYDAMWG